ncbi:hypothetical protein [Thiomicrorhabdus sp.]|uniref:tetratricopeptide repeat protein n=1 Tax=Thiomicrorhabdus sp. TaxID=2039724 RepID=UPI002AA894D7|nr:hypothetical protein [Thiomicrorhabdus sp.]
MSVKNKLIIVLNVLAITLLGGCSQTPTKLADLQKQAYQQPKTEPLATNLNDKDEYEFALDLVGLEIKRQHYSRAEVLLQKLRKIDRTDVRIYRLLGQVYEAQNKLDLALIAWKEVNKSNDKTTKDEAQLGRLALMENQFKLAESIYQAWLNSDKEVVQVSGLNNLGFSAMLQKKNARAKTYFLQALQKDPLNSKAMNNLKLLDTLVGRL